MKLIEIAKRGSGRNVQIQFTVSELIAVVALFEILLGEDTNGHAREKTMLAKFRNIIKFTEHAIENRIDYRNDAKVKGKILYGYKEGVLDEVQRAVEDGTGESFQ